MFTKLKVNKDGVISFTDKQWKVLLEMAGCKSKSYKVQQKAVYELVIAAIKKGMDEPNSNR